MGDVLTKLVDRDAERATLGACLIDNTQLVEVVDLIEPGHFWLEGHRHIFQAMVDLFQADRPIDIITLSEAIKVYANLDAIGNGSAKGLTYLTNLTTDEIYTYNATHYAKIVADLARRRELVIGCQATASQAFDRSVAVPDVVELGCQSMLRASVNGERALRPMGEDLDEFSGQLIKRIESDEKHNPGINTGFFDIDNRTNGLEKSMLWVIAGRPGMGKTAWLVGLACMLSLDDTYRGAIFSLEMSREELYKRMIAYQTRINLQRIARGELDPDERRQVDRALEQLQDARRRLWIDDTPGLTPTQIRARASQMSMKMGLDYVWIDYLQLVHVPEAQGSNYIQATEASRESKNLAKYLEVPVLVASQLNRKVEDKPDKRPELSHLRDSGGIEEAADLVGLLYRHEYYDEDSPIPNEGEFIIGKQRSGPSGGSVRLCFLKRCAGYYNLQRHEARLEQDEIPF
jgi:replicative DNA helicase